MRIGYLECFSGISGDMFLGALIDAGVPLSHLSEITSALGVGARLEAAKTSRGGITGTRVDVILADDAIPVVAHSQGEQAHAHPDTHSQEFDRSHQPEQSPHHALSHGQEHSHEHTSAPANSQAHEHHRSLSMILSIIRSAPLPGEVKQRAMRGFQLLGEAEAAIHSIPVERVHFHEVGAADTIVDIVCAAAGAAFLNIDRWLASTLNVGSGTVNCAHGILPVPAPATLALLGNAPVYAAGLPMERVTPTGATILRMLEVKYCQLPTIRVTTSGYGAGGRDTPGQPNLLRLLIGEDDETDSAVEPIAILETVIDDSTPQLIAYVSDLLLASGAWDVYRIPVQMKKGRTGVQLTILCCPDRLPALRDLLFRETTTIGMHWRIESKISLRREFVQVETHWGTVQIKVARWASGKVANAAPEYEDCRRLAVLHSVPLKQVMQEAARLYHASNAAFSEDTDGSRTD